MKRSIDYYKNRIDILSMRDPVMNKNLIAKLTRIVRNMEMTRMANIIREWGRAYAT